ncbi:MAG: alpha/beta fold hydrolase [Chloroflexota bacterium]
MDGEVFSIDRGAGLPASLCIHGFCQSSRFWEPVVDLIAGSGGRAVAPDLPGFGGSAGVAGPFTMEGYADWLASLIRSLDVGSVSVIGGSMGGVIAQHLVLRHPDVVARLVLVATGGNTPNPQAALDRANMLESTEWTPELAQATAAGFFYRQLSPADLDSYSSIVLQADRAAAVSAARSNALSATLERLVEVRVPTLIVQGREDRGRTPSHGADMRDRIPGSRLVVLDGAGHTPQLERTEEFWDVVKPFLLAG